MSELIKLFFDDFFLELVDRSFFGYFLDYFVYFLGSFDFFSLIAGN